MNSLWSSKSVDDDVPATKEPPPTGDVADAVVADVGPDADNPPPPPPPARPSLQRNTSAPSAVPAPAPVPPAPMPPAPSDQPQPTDSLSLMQLRRIVAEFSRGEPVAYDFVYSDMGSHDEEIDEWFVYQFWQWVRLNAAQRAFEWQWQHEYDMHTTWEETEHEARAKFTQDALDGLQVNDLTQRSASLGKILYLVLGRWGDTSTPATIGDRRSAASATQLVAIRSSIAFLTSLGGIGTVWEALQNCFNVFWLDDPRLAQPGGTQEAQDELINLMTIMYVIIQEALSFPKELETTRSELLSLKPGLVDFLSMAAAKLRWDDGNLMPSSQIFLLFWKTVLLVFGGTQEIDEAKKATSESPNVKSKDVITASPLDYHVFRQELTSKYPAYVPPRTLIPLEPENTTLLPPLPNHPTRTSAAIGIVPGPPNPQSSGASILHQPVHIATPAPSPPPSPGVGGKGGKKQNYQTNQNFPFMYPPLDATSNSAGGKGGAGLQEQLVGRRWEGSDIPASILEAGELFSKRVRMTRATRQFWEEREGFLKFERGWEAEDSDDDVDSLDLEGLSLEEKQEIAALKAETRAEERREAQVSVRGPEIDCGPAADKVSDEVKRRLLAVESFYKESLPHMQSLVIVLLRPILVNVTAVLAQPAAAQQHPSMAGRGANGMNGGPGSNRQQQTQEPSSTQSGPAELPEMSPEEVDAARSREITTKAVTAILLLLLKWLRVSHVLKFEYMTQLLLDSNYLPLVLKLFAHQDVQQVVDSKTDRLENSFFHFCNLRSKFKDQPPVQGEPEEESEDEAAPPPIKRRRSPPRATTAATSDGDDNARVEGQAAVRPEVDELGYPVNDLPAEPITDFSRRNFFSLINYLRIMQKICKHKAHRNLLLVQYKSANILRKSLKIPQPELRLYTLKLFKNQVPYCGRKWRQSNMRVITAVYLHCRPELRDEWLAGSDVDADVDSALPLEQALRSLTHWFNVRWYPDKIAVELRAALREEQDFFTRELEKLDMNWADVGLDDGANSEWDEAAGWP
ncbi:Transmembrane hyphal anastomosis protein ham2 far11 [Colletotrichum higginsianum IMI 349063]|uniref:Transmembrane hyphal anastomosis protein ham2 far11 n=1 Tax=Colletotrichum higginsianum (strain IMI 349063) TaxID=759273 RepID=A0A1B7YIY7_COLHI|nr:Transmembrane hyphal anastomosis protein ham2 far11 [Colletotrichum higginsianum IMI 349063]OBR12061.1 Transmembrane hyphal anastomosis protein ham2 far11 [Colletotrichum higginsianum IMI 349063]